MPIQFQFPLCSSGSAKQTVIEALRSFLCVFGVAIIIRFITCDSGNKKFHLLQQLMNMIWCKTNGRNEANVWSNGQTNSLSFQIENGMSFCFENYSLAHWQSENYIFLVCACVLGNKHRMLKKYIPQKSPRSIKKARWNVDFPHLCVCVAVAMGLRCVVGRYKSDQCDKHLRINIPFFAASNRHAITLDDE